MKLYKNFLTLSILTTGLYLTGCNHDNIQNEKLSSDIAVSSPVSSTNTPSTSEQKILLENTTPIDTDINQNAIAKIPKNYHFVEAGYFTVGTYAGSPPIAVMAPDNKTVIGTEADIARLIADSLGLKLKLVVSSWEDWPLGLSSGKYDAVLANITVTKERKEKFDFATYRQDVLGIYVSDKSQVKKIENADDIAGLKVIVGAGTNQEKVLLTWIEDNKKKGLKPAQALYYNDNASASLALQSGRADAILGPNAIYAWQALNGAKIHLAGLIKGGWPRRADIAVTVKKGSGLAEPIQIALNGVIQNGKYSQILDRWGVKTEAVSDSEINPPGLGDQ